ncbi:MAG: hypothetical protein D3926_20045 [Desulfobacteraceae bacterium]|nr:MAG: hypothetical protein D3926_20045 [Desulfobacteraceae bacterium]
MGLLDTIKDQSEAIQQSLIENRLTELKTQIETHAAGMVLDKVLYGLLEAMGLLFLLNEEYRRNIKDFEASYVIHSEDGEIDVTAIFKKVPFLFKRIDGMDVKDTAISDPTTAVTFKDGKAMADFLLSGNTDVIEGMLDNKLSVSGNLNYLFKFIYLLWLIPELLGINDFKELLSARA